jgi:hypothetical protein
LERICTRALNLPKKNVEAKSEEERRKEKTRKKDLLIQCNLQTYLNKDMSPQEVQDICDSTWLDPRESPQLKKTCAALRAAVMSKTLLADKKLEDKFIKQADALRNRNEWALDKRHTYRRMILTDQTPSWMQPVEVMVRHCQPIWIPDEENADGSPNIDCYHHSPPSEDSPWTIRREEDAPGTSRDYRKFMTNRIAVAKCLKTKNNLSALGMDGIGYLFLKLGEVPMIEFIRKVFKECVKARDVPETWKQSRTVFIFKKGDMKLPNNWRPITITSRLYGSFIALNATFIQMKVHKQDKLRIFSNAQKGFVAGVPGCMEHAIMTRELMAHAIHNQRDLHMIQIDYTNAFGSVPHGSIAYDMRCIGLLDVQAETVMKIYEGAATVISVPTGVSQPIRWKSGTVQGCPLSPTLFNICIESFLLILEQEEGQQYGFKVTDRDGREVTSINVTAYADDLILFAETYEGSQKMLDLLADFCNYSGMEVNTRKCAAVSITWNPGKREDLYHPFLMNKSRYRMDERGMLIPKDSDQKRKPKKIPSQEASIYLGLPIGMDKDECSLHGAAVLKLMKEHIRKLGSSNFYITQKMEVIKLFKNRTSQCSSETGRHICFMMRLKNSQSPSFRGQPCGSHNVSHERIIGMRLT